MKIDSLDELFQRDLEYLFDAEHQLVKALPKMARAASAAELAAAFERHLVETRGHVARLEEIFGLLGAEPASRVNTVVQEMTEEADRMVLDTDVSAVRDGALVLAGTQVEGFEMAGYRAARALAERLGHTDAVRLLDLTLGEETAADEALWGIGTALLRR